MTIFGMLRVKNEDRWIAKVIDSIAPLCERIFILDDHSTDCTREFCWHNEKVTLYESPFYGLDETRDKNWLLAKICDHVSEFFQGGCPTSPYWVLAIDGDEILATGGVDAIANTLKETPYHAFKLPIWYLWNDWHLMRVDGVYERFARPSIFRLMNKNFRFMSTPWGGNFHCSSIPQELLHAAHIPLNAPLLHTGYMQQHDRLRKYAWYNTQDPNNPAEDCYRHMVIGDLFPSESKFLHAGPLAIKEIPHALRV